MPATSAVITSGTYTLAATSDDGSRVYLDNLLVVDNCGNHGTRTQAATIHLDAGHRYPLRVEYCDNKGAASVKLGWTPPGGNGSPLQQAVAAAKASDAAIVMVGDSRHENHDRSTIALTDRQNNLVNAVAAVNPDTVVVAKSGGPVLMPWADKVHAIVEAWYPGQQDGAAVAAVLFGDVDPSGKLPVTFPASESSTPLQTQQQYPGVNLQVRYPEGLDVGYRWYNATGTKPLFPFGYGTVLHELRRARHPGLAGHLACGSVHGGCTGDQHRRPDGIRDRAVVPHLPPRFLCDRAGPRP